MIALHSSILRTWGRERVGVELRKLYDDTLKEPVPQDMLDLLRRLQ